MNCVRGTTKEELAAHFEDSSELEWLMLKDGFTFILFRMEVSVALAQ